MVELAPIVEAAVVARSQSRQPTVTVDGQLDSDWPCSPIPTGSLRFSNT